MGIFQKYVKVFNRAPIERSVTFDGQRERIPVGHAELPDVTVLFAKNQNPIMGTADPNDPSVHGGKFLITTEEDEGYGIPLTDKEWQLHLGKPQRMDAQAAFEERYGNDPKAKLVTHGAPGKPAAKSRYEAGMGPGGNAVFDGHTA